MSSYVRVPSETIPDDLAGSALDACVRTLFDLSWNRARDLVRRGKVAVDGRTVTDPTARVRKGSAVVLDLAARRVSTQDLPEGALVHVDSHIVVVEKPSGISTIPFDKDDQEPTLDVAVRNMLSRRGPPPALGIVHRIDKETSGLVVFTRTWAAKKALSDAFRAHTVHRRYLALVHGVPKEGTIRSHFVPDRGDGLRGSVEKRRGRNRAVGSEQTQLAVTHITVEKTLKNAALVACRLETGRTHQIRIHLSEAGHPVIGERVYIRGFAGTPVSAPRLMLHAAELGFVHPATNREMKWTSPLPKDMQEMLRFLA
jgi:23S rRNA pseudouridine1911/1915/1917 synthase